MLKSLMTKTGCQIYIPKTEDDNSEFRQLQLIGTAEQIGDAKREINVLIQSVKFGQSAADIQKDFESAKNQLATMNMVYGPLFNMQQIISQTQSELGDSAINMNLLFSQFLHFDPYYSEYYKTYYKKLQDGKVEVKEEDKDKAQMHMLSMPSVFKSLPKEIQ